jgi:hypothetical protein
MGAAAAVQVASENDSGEGCAIGARREADVSMSGLFSEAKGTIAAAPCVSADPMDQAIVNERDHHSASATP